MVALNTKWDDQGIRLENWEFADWSGMIEDGESISEDLVEGEGKGRTSWKINFISNASLCFDFSSCLGANQWYLLRFP